MQREDLGLSDGHSPMPRTLTIAHHRTTREYFLLCLTEKVVKNVRGRAVKRLTVNG